MSKETPTPEEEAEAKLAQEGESDEQKEFNKLFEGIDFDDEEKSKEDLIAEFEKFKENANKNFAKFYSKKGMELGKKEEPAPKPAVKQEDASDLEVIFFEGKPEASLVKDDLKTIAEAKGISLIQAWKNESWIQDKAKALHAAKSEAEKNASRVGNPSEGVEIEKDAETKARENSFISNLPPGFSAATPKY